MMLKRVGLMIAAAAVVCCVAMSSVVSPAEAWSHRAAHITAMAWAHRHCGDEIYKCNGGRLTSLRETGFNDAKHNQWTFVVEGVETQRKGVPLDPLLPYKQAVKWVGGIRPDGSVRNGMKLVDVVLFPYAKKGYTPISQNKAEGIATAKAERDCMGLAPDLQPWRCLQETIQPSQCASTHMTAPEYPGWLCTEVYLQHHWLFNRTRACSRTIPISPKGDVLKKLMTKLKCVRVDPKTAVVFR